MEHLSSARPAPGALRRRARTWSVAAIVLVTALSGCLQASPATSGTGAAPAAPADATSSVPDAATSIDGTVKPALTAGPADTSGPPGQPAQPSTVVTAASAIVPGVVNRTSIHIVATYDAGVLLGFDNRTLTVDVTMNVTNRSGSGIDRVELNTITGPLGKLRMGLVEVDGKVVTPTVEDQTIRVPLGGVLPHTASAVLRVRLRATFPSTLGGSNWMFTRVGSTLQANRWLPWVGLHRPFERPNHGDPFFTALSPHIRVRITTDRPLHIATPGGRVSIVGRTQTFEATNVRDFPIVASPDFTIRELKVGNRTLRAYVRAGFPTTTVLNQAADALTRMDALAGPYPYSRLVIAQTAGGYALEGPGMIWIPTGLTGEHLRWNVYHEVAHQWFYGIVGSDHAREPFADETVATHLGQYVSGIWRTTSCPMRRLDLSIYKYTATCYFGQIYLRGANLLRRVRAEMEIGAYFEAIRDYVATYRFRIGTTRAFLETLQSHTSTNLESILAPWFPSIY